MKKFYLNFVNYQFYALLAFNNFTNQDLLSLLTVS